MEGKRVIQPEVGEETRKRLPLAGIIAAVLAALLLGAALGLCLYANGYGDIFPGVTVGGIDLGGMDRETAQGVLSAKMNELTDPYTITITADGQELGGPCVRKELTVPRIMTLLIPEVCRPTSG